MEFVTFVVIRKEYIISINQVSVTKDLVKT